MSSHLSRQKLNVLLQAKRIDQLSLTELATLIEQEPVLADFKPDGLCQTDPRNGDRIIYNSARARRPHDNRPAEDEHEQHSAQKPCVVCQGETTGIVDMAELSEGFTFINKNLFPVLYPQPDTGPKQHSPGPNGQPVAGLHLLQWTSSQHDRDWHNMPTNDRLVVMQRLAAAESVLLHGEAAWLPQPAVDENALPRRFVSIIKNYGHLVGGSLVHGHQQIGLSNVMPRRIHDNWRFAQHHAEPFSAYLLRKNPPTLQLRDYGPAVLLVPYFMRRPLDMMLLLKDSHKQYLHQLSLPELAAVADGWRDAINLILQLMPRLGRETAYNIVTHNGPGAGLYFEFLPYTQENGGFEHLGLHVCQATPPAIAAQLQRALAQSSNSKFE